MGCAVDWPCLFSFCIVSWSGDMEGEGPGWTALLAGGECYRAEIQPFYCVSVLISCLFFFQVSRFLLQDLLGLQCNAELRCVLICQVCLVLGGW